MDEIIQLIGLIALVLYNAALFFILLDVPLKRIGKREIFLIIEIALILVCNIFVYLFLDVEKYAVYFSLITHLPLAVAFAGLSKYKGFKLVFITLTVIVLCSPILLISNTVSYFFGFTTFSNTVTKLILYLPLLVLVKHYLKPPLKFMLNNCDTGWALFCAIPMLACIAIYVNGQYRFTYDLEIWRDTALWRYFISAITFLSYGLIFKYFIQTKEQMEAKGTLALLKTQLDGTVLYINSLKNSQRQADVYYHDLRHHFRLIGSYAAKNDCKAILNYTAKIEKNIDTLTPHTYCKNDALNLILSAFKAKAEANLINFCVDLELNEAIVISDMDLCLIFSNALENAINAANMVTDRPREINLSCRVKNNQLFLEIKNPYQGEIEFENGLPKSTGTGSGIGTKSIALIVEKHAGLYSFEAIHNEFILSIIV